VGKIRLKMRLWYAKVASKISSQVMFVLCFCALAHSYSMCKGLPTSPGGMYLNTLSIQMALADTEKMLDSHLSALSSPASISLAPPPLLPDPSDPKSLPCGVAWAAGVPPAWHDCRGLLSRAGIWETTRLLSSWASLGRVSPALCITSSRDTFCRFVSLCDVNLSELLTLHQPPVVRHRSETYVSFVVADGLQKPNFYVNTT